MPRVKCPHCGAGNQDATEEDTCWQCSSVLGSPALRTESAIRPSAALSSEPTQQLNIEMLQKLSPEIAPQPAPLPSQSAPRSAINPILILLGALLICVIILLVYALMRR